ncbi:tripartite tricarboxylate transporter TctB family protein [Marinovum sp. 2_MG-2023]|uniref:tripartite tricarboxylate transporter TctB family protein n=1 Tax=unclassified Marinovum TaxID=2647166 RepID=UPI0026E284D9|nr:MULTISPECIES: tripartite tricarboxylate transporter TctB family protein [unclassified Marinovum]MDO6732614.1 tripartite tricarboxylate transporter TctB family protein [Marinovum sp. 2_MG-2023]MDO6781913.1 tripartite tricarboxylate transporter TctB family protein [Marinovum sp. 1_MG-2023]
MKTLNWLPPAAFLVFGAVFLAMSLRLGESFGGGYAHRTVPLCVSTTVLVLSAWQVLKALQNPEKADDNKIDPKEFLLHALPLVFLMGLYGVFQTWFGFILASLSIGIVVFRLFGNSWVSAAINAVIATTIFYALFFDFMNLYNPPGRLLDLPGIF